MCACMCLECIAHVCPGTPVHTCRGQKGMVGSSSIIVCLSFWDRISLEPRAPPVSTCFRTEVTMHGLGTQIVMCVLRSKLWSSCLPSKYFYNGAISPSLFEHWYRVLSLNSTTQPCLLWQSRGFYFLAYKALGFPRAAIIQCMMRLH